jgi:hypothetical protein
MKLVIITTVTKNVPNIGKLQEILNELDPEVADRLWKQGTATARQRDGKTEYLLKQEGGKS